MGKVSKALEKALKFNDNSAIPTDLSPEELNHLPPSASAPAKTISANHNDVSILETHNTNWDERLLLSTDEASPIAETFKRLRSKILHPASGTPPRTILFTSVAPQEGKGFVCANLGVALAKGIGEHAILVDCDLRRPSLSAMFGVSNERGLADYLQKNVDLASLIKKTSLHKLVIIPSGPPPDNPAELLDSSKMAQLVDELSRRYDDRLILLDAPPNMVASETIILSKYVDGIVIVVRWGKSNPDDVKKLVDSLERKKIIGIVFNAYERSNLDDYLTKKQGYDNSYYSSYHK